MSIKSKSLQLKGSQGNAFYILEQAKKISKEQGIDFLPIQKEMMSGDYKNMLKVFNHYFGGYVDIIS